jgi:glyoxylase-like metal-dependent hydrolase (beta-lactamase superfamily II)
VDVEQLAPGLWRWTAWHEEWRAQVGCVYYETGGGVCLIDPLVPPEDRERFRRALDRDVARVGGPVDVLLTIFWHARSARELAERYGARVRAPSRARAAAARRAGDVLPLRPGDVLAGDVEAHDSGRPGEVLYLLPAAGALVAGDVLLGAEGGGLRLCPASWLPAGRGHDGVRAALGPLAEQPIERVLVSHGEPVRTGGAAALATLL